MLGRLLAVLQAEVGEPGRAERQADVASDLGPPARCIPVLNSREPPVGASLSWKFITPAVNGTGGESPGRLAQKDRARTFLLEDLAIDDEQRR